MIGITFRQLEVFVQTVEAGSFRLCAERLGVSQVSISEHIRTLEKQLGCALFIRRRGAPAGLTEPGGRAYRHARDVLAATEGFLGEFGAATRDRSRRKLTIGAHGYIANRFTRCLAGFTADHPELEIELETHPYESLLQALSDGEVDVGYFYSLGPVTELDSTRIWREALGLYVGAEHPLANRDLVEAAELCRYPLVYLPEKSHMRSLVDEVLRRLGIAGCPVAFQSEHLGHVTEGVMRGMGFVCLFADAVTRQIEAGTLRALRLAMPVPSLDVRQTVRTPYRLDRTVAELTGYLARHAAGESDDRI